MANERFNSWLINEGDARQVGIRSLTRTLLTAALLTVIGVLVVWAFFLLLATACVALYALRLSGAWRWIYVVTALVSLYLNVFVLVIQTFLKIPPLHAIAPGEPPAGPVFAVVQGIVLVFFVVMIIRVWRRFKPA